MNASRITVVALLCALVALCGCRREEAAYEPLKLGGPAMEKPSR